LTADPLGGSFYVEQLTDEIEEKANEYLEKIEKMGGAVKSIEAGYMQTEIARAALQWQKAVESGKKIIVGVNAYQTSEKNETPVLKIDESIRQWQSEKLMALRQDRNAENAGAALRKLTEAARSNHNLMPAVLHCCEQECTLGEIADALRAVYGEYKA
jgi:methylmalonyl-CoA mutase N-terminal domain/subunit